MQCQTKSKYRGVWVASSIDVDADNMALLLMRDGNTKSLPFLTVSRCEIAQNEGQSMLLLQSGERQYEIRGKRVGQVVQVYRLWKFFQEYKEVPERKMQKPKVINYQDRCAAILSKQKETKNAQKRQAQRLKEQKRSQEEIVEYEDYYKKTDWLRDPEEGGLLFINQEKKSLQPKIIKFLISRFLSTGSFMGISFPVFAMKPESILETYCRCLSLAPRLLTGHKNPIERMKAFNAAILTMSLRFIDIDKAYNPTLGETFQTSIEGYQMTAQQVSHHPPVSAFLLIGEDFELYGLLEVQASMGFNTARGRFYGDIVLEYKDGGRLISRLPCGVLTGFLYGRYFFGPDGANYCYDPLNQLVSSYRVTQGDVMEGYIGKLTQKHWLQFFHLMNAPKDEKIRVKRYENFEHVGEEQCEKIYHRMRVIWTKSVHYDGQLYIDYEDESFQAPKLTRKIPKNLLPSDSRHRKDILLRAEEKLDESQQEKERIEQEERRLRKLRQSFKEINQ